MYTIENMENAEGLENRPNVVTPEQIDHLDRGIELLGILVNMQGDRMRFGVRDEQLSDIAVRHGINVSDYYLELIRPV